MIVLGVPYGRATLCDSSEGWEDPPTSGLEASKTLGRAFPTGQLLLSVMVIGGGGGRIGASYPAEKGKEKPLGSSEPYSASHIICITGKKFSTKLCC